jgi:hypothetical protein
MKKFVLFGVITVLFLFAGQALAGPPGQYSEEVVTGTTQGNHDLDCTVILSVSGHCLGQRLERGSANWREHDR